MALFVDTSAIYAIADRADQGHQRAYDLWLVLAERRESLITSNYVILEAFALIGRRMGRDAERTLQSDIVPVLRVHWVDESLHERAVAALLTSGDRHLSLVDCVSFEVMRRLGLDTAFAFDEHFARQGFRLIP